LPADPDLPARLPQRFYCPVPAEVPPKADLKLRCAIKASSSLKAVVLNYRAPGSEEFTRVVMTKGKKGWYEGVVPASAMVGSVVQIFMEAAGWGDKVLHTVGTSGSPTVISVQGAATQGEVEPEKDPLRAAADARSREERRRELRLHTREPNSMFLGLGGGFGGGWMPSRSLDFRTDGKATGTAHEGLLHIIPELGYQLSDDWAVAVQLRYQMIPGSGSGDATRSGEPAKTAWAALLHVYRFYGESNFQGFLSASAGGGAGFRLYVAPQADNGFPRSDTVVGGPVVLGPGAGIVYHFSENWAFVLEGRALAGVPKFAVLGEGTASLQWSFWTKAKPGALPEPMPETDPTLSE
jgi:hypothetical protein